MRQSQYVKTAYLEQAGHYEETLRFLNDLNWIEELHDEVVLSDVGLIAWEAVEDDRGFRELLLKALFVEESPYRADLADFLLRFGLHDGELSYRPVFPDRPKESPVRNLLIDLRVVSHRATDDTYLIALRSADLYVCAINIGRSRSKESVRSDWEQKAQLGLAAEQVILGYEKDRLGARWTDQVQHVSATIPLACYDIRSVTIQGGTAIPRYIEVKAVPPESYQFYWSHSELEVAQLLGSQYYLYLIPVSPLRGFDLAGLQIVQSPYSSVYKNPDFWAIEENVIVCKKRRQAHLPS
jgi:hypothetical protein